MSSKLKIYTKTGDRGDTSLYGGKRVIKSHRRVKSYGSIDELNSVLGMVMAKTSDQKIRRFINKVQNDLFVMGAALAGSPQDLGLLVNRVEEMEGFIDELDGELPELKNFILPGGGEEGAVVHFARSVSRRVEREVVKLAQEEEVDKRILIYLNRLSDLLFITGRYLNQKEKRPEIVWKGSN